MCSNLGGTLVVYQRPQDTPRCQMHKEAFTPRPMEAEIQPPSWPMNSRGFRLGGCIPEDTGSPGKNGFPYLCPGFFALLVKRRRGQCWGRTGLPCLGILNNRIVLMGTASIRGAGLLGMAAKEKGILTSNDVF